MLGGTGLDQPNVPEWRTPIPVVHESKVFQRRRCIKCLANQSARMKCSHLRPKDDATAGQKRDVDRLNSIAVTGDDEFTGALVPDGARKHAVEPGKQPVSPLFPAMDEHLSV